MIFIVGMELSSAYERDKDDDARIVREHFFAISDKDEDAEEDVNENNLREPIKNRDSRSLAYAS